MPAAAPPPEQPATASGPGGAVRLLLPSLLAIVLFVTAVFALLIPGMESAIMARKQEMVRELTAAAWNILDHFQGEAAAGRMSQEQAQAQAIALLRDFRYGHENKDYLWIIDDEPRMIMHPYRPELEGEAVGTLTDSHGKQLFRAFVDESAAAGEAQVDYYWQWKDDDERIVPKSSYVRRFTPWGWIVGTGIYLDDAHREIAAITRRFWFSSAAIGGIICLLLLINYRTGMRIEIRRRAAEGQLQHSRERYRALVEANDEGVLLVIDNRITTINRCAQEQLGYESDGLRQASITDLLIDGSPARHLYDSLAAGEANGHAESDVRGAEGRLLPAMITGTRMRVLGQDGIILTIKPLTAPALDRPEGGPMAALLDQVGCGLLRCAADRDGRITEANQALADLLDQPRANALIGRSARRAFRHASERQAFNRALIDHGRVDGMPCELRRHDGAAVPVRLWARRDGDQVLAAVLDRRREEDRARQAEELLGDLTTAQGQILAPIDQLTKPAPTLPLSATIATVAACMTHTKSPAVLITDEAGTVVGIVTEGDIARRVVAEGLDVGGPVHRIMSAPMQSCGSDSTIAAAIDQMRDQQLEHLAIDIDHQAPRLLDAQSLLDASRSGMPALQRRIAGAVDSSALRGCRDATHTFIQALLRAGFGSLATARCACGLADAILARCAALALAELGPAPGPWCLLAVGSQGRHEMAFATDQDNALVYDDRCGEAERPWFLRFADRINTIYAEAGYAYCAGEAMARNPKWCQSLASWQACFQTWIHRPEPQDLKDVNVFFDFHHVAGDPRLAASLRETLLTMVRGRSIFFLQLAEETLIYKPPVGLFGGLRMEADDEHGPGFCIKSALIPLINFARLYALAEGIAATNTIDRLDAMRDRRSLLPDSHRVLVRAYRHLAEIRLRHHARLQAAGQEIDNRIDSSELDDWDHAELKRIFGHIADMQARIRYDFARQA